jgi:beta-lactamase superfamily II metal-dependent hydrolase
MRTLCLPLLVLATLPLSATVAADQPVAPPATFTLWQLPEQTGGQMMSYVLRTTGGKILVIDGGRAGDAPYLRGFLGALGNKVEAWFITHPHLDHIDALTEILAQPRGIEIGTIYASMPDGEWMAKYVHESDEGDTVPRFNKALEAAKKSLSNLELGQLLEIDGVHVEILGIRNPEITSNPLNNSSIVMRVWDSTKSILFLGDLGVEGGEKLLQGSYRDKLHADYVQMAHHGQNGVGKDVYEAIRPTHCLWPTPRWLWNNNAGKGNGTGPWKTLEVRAWMDELSVKSHFVTADGLQRIE